MSTMKEDVLAFLEDHLGSRFTATEIARELEYKLSSVSSLLKKLYDDGAVFRVRNFGPRGGYGYMMIPYW